MVNPWLGMGLVLSIFGVLMAGLRAYRRWRSPDPERLRKLLHMGMGAVTLTLPWLFKRPWPVVCLALLFVSGLTALRASRSLQRGLGGIIDGVDRKSLGDIYFPAAVGLLFLWSAGDPLMFCLPVLLLTFADAAAALAGTRYGGLRFPSARGAKSVEGSTAFFAVAFLSTHIPLLLFTDTARAASLLIALTLAIQVTLLEAGAWGGLDNLLIPLAAFILLKSFLPLDLISLVARFSLALLLLTLFFLFCRQHAGPASDNSVRHSLFLRDVQRSALGVLGDELH